MSVDPLRVHALNAQPVREDGEYVLYWMIAARRTRSNPALEHAVVLANAMKLPLVVLEALRCDYPWASDRFHRFVIDGMRDQTSEFAAAGVSYHAYVEPRPGEGKGLLESMAQRAVRVVTDDFPCFFLPRMVEHAAARVGVRMESVDGNGLLPLRAVEKVFPTAYAFRRQLQRVLPEFLQVLPESKPLSRLKAKKALPIRAEIKKRWPGVQKTLLSGELPSRQGIPLRADIGPTGVEGGSHAAHARLQGFLATKLSMYGSDRSEVESDVVSGLSPYLHFGHLGPHEVLAALAAQESWSLEKLGPERRGTREGFWGMSSDAEAWIDQWVTWRELGYNFCSKRSDYAEFESLPAWALATLRKHRTDRRDPSYSLRHFEVGDTHDPLWNAAQGQLVSEGRIHNYLRMLWGKKILEWSKTPEEALDTMIELNNRYALDGRNPNSYSGIFWTLGRYDRPWAPERPIFGTIRFMSSANTARKFKIKGYLARYGGLARPDATTERGLFDE